MAIRVWAKSCGHLFTWIQGDLPRRCPSCGIDTAWSTLAEPAVAYVLSKNDRRLLRALRISPE